MYGYIEVFILWSNTGMNAPFTKQAALRELASTDQLTNHVHFGHSSTRLTIRE